MNDQNVGEQKQLPRSSADYANYSPPPKKSKMPTIKTPSLNWRRPAKYLLILLILAAIGAGVYKFVLNKPEKAKPANQANTSQTSQPQADQISTVTKNYSSQEFALSFDHPDDWTVTDTPGSGRLTVSSPDIQLTDSDGKPATGKISMNIRNKRQSLPEFDKGNALAARASEKVSYSKPSPSQRGETYISLLLWASSTGSDGDFDGIYITGNNGYQKDQVAPKADFAAVDPVINVTFSKSGSPLTISDNIWDNPRYSKPIKDMLQSLVIN